jgi:pimeloyl-ACP methyl ester carboxylesterase
MSLTTSASWGIKDEWHASEDIMNRRYRYIRNGFYSQSPLFRAGRDLAIFSALLYFKVLIEDVPYNRDFEKQPGLKDAKQLVHSVCSSSTMKIALEESAYLRARLLYLLKDLRALQVNPDVWKKEVTEFGLDRLSDYLLEEGETIDLQDLVSELVNASGPIMISARVGGDHYRLPDFTESWSLDIEGSHEFRTRAQTRQFDGPVGLYKRGLAPGQVILASSPRIPVNPGVSSSSKIGKITHEFFHAAIPFDLANARHFEQFGPSDMSVLMELAPSGENTGTPVVVSIPSVCSVKADGNNATLYVRVNALGFLEESEQLTQCPPEEEVMLQSFIVVNAVVSNATSEDPSQTGADCDDSDKVVDIEENPEYCNAAAPDGNVNQPETAPSIVFIHGIFSECASCFPEMSQSFKTDPRFSGHRLFDFDYDFNDPMEMSAENLTDFLEEEVGPGPVCLVCHSMGGLVARLSVLDGSVRSAKRIIMLGTPNFGAVRTAQLGFLSQLAMQLSGNLYALFRKPGIRDLTKVTAIFKGPILAGRQFADDVEYVTIPGEYFNESRPFLDIGGSSAPDIWTGGFAALSVAAELLTAAPLWRIALQRPHDGIVEAASNSFIPCSAGRASEKCPTINHPDRFGRTYVHITHECCSELTHVMIQHNPFIIELVKDIAASATIHDWYGNLNPEQLRGIRAIFS